MRNISFVLTMPQFLDGSKTVTRRIGWNKPKHKAEEGLHLMGCEKCQGIQKGGLNRLGEIVVVSARREPLWAIDRLDCIREGFPEMEPDDFIEMFGDHMKCNPDEILTRIEFDHVQLHQDRFPCPRCRGRHKFEAIHNSDDFYCPKCSAVWTGTDDSFIIANPKLRVSS